MKELDLNVIGSDYRPVPFWSWNDELEIDELKRQIREMKKAGLGGFFMHARGGLKTKYMGKQWMACVRACIREADRLGMNAYLYDENGWPSGFGDGMVNGMGPEFQQKYLRFEVIDAVKAAKKTETIAFYSADGSEYFGTSLPADAPAKILRAYYELNPFYVDNLDKNVVALFLEKIYEFYFKELPKELSSKLKGVFTDEPQLSRRGLVWSLTLPREFKKRYGVDLLPLLPQLQFDLAGSAKTRVAFWQLAGDLFSKNFMKQIHDWCSRHGWTLTGHHVLEESYNDQLSTNGSLMNQLQYYHIPGIDHLGRVSSHSTADYQVVSVAAQRGRKQILAETFGCAGWNFNFVGMKWLHQQHMVHGINLLCQHLEGYSLKGMRKRDYPASHFIHQPFWDDSHIINDYFGRIGKFLAEGEIECETLVLHGESTAWMYYKGNDREAINDAYFQSLNRLTALLEIANIPFHYGDEAILRDSGKIEGNVLTVDRMRYKRIILPAVGNLSGSTLALFREFAAAGGEICQVTDTISPDSPRRIDGETASVEELAAWQSFPVVADEAAALDWLLQANPARIDIKLQSGVEGQLRGTWRKFAGSRIYYIANFDFVPGKTHYNDYDRIHQFVSTPGTEADCVAEITIPSGRAVRVIDQATGKVGKGIDFVTLPDGKIRFLRHFATTESLLFQVDDVCDVPARSLGNEFEYQLTDGNLLTLDRCDYRVDGGEWQLNTEVMAIGSRLLQQERKAELDLRFHFTLDQDFDLSTPLSLLVEEAKNFRFALNGKTFDGKVHGFLFDRAFEKITLPDKLKHGENELLLSCTFHQSKEIYAALKRAIQFEGEANKLYFDMEIESIYLLGDFAVRHHGAIEAEGICRRFNGTFTLGCPGKTLNMSSALDENLPFYAGTVKLKKELTLTRREAAGFRKIAMSPFAANSVKIRVNGKLAGAIFWAPYEVDVEGLLKAGKNRIELEFTTSLRNLLGPHHLLDFDPIGIGPTSFNTEPDFLGRPGPTYHPGYVLLDFFPKEIQLK